MLQTESAESSQSHAYSTHMYRPPELDFQLFFFFPSLVIVVAGTSARVCSAAKLQHFLALWREASACRMLPSSLPPGPPPSETRLEAYTPPHAYRHAKRELAEAEYERARELLLRHGGFAEWRQAKRGLRAASPSLTPGPR